MYVRCTDFVWDQANGLRVKICESGMFIFIDITDGLIDVVKNKICMKRFGMYRSCTKRNKNLSLSEYVRLMHVQGNAIQYIKTTSKS